MSKKIVLGIDLGTTYSCVAYIDEHEKPVVLKIDDGESTIPSVVFFESEENVVVGKAAKEYLKIEPGKTINFIKQKIGKEDNMVDIPYDSGNKSYSAIEVSSYILKKIVEDANQSLREKGVLSDDSPDVKDVVITCPAYFGNSERDQTKKAGELIGLNVMGIINEPTAAAINYGLIHKDEKMNVLIYDLGGGTFDVTLMNIDNGNISVICTDGDDTLGGKDWDETLIEYILEQINIDTGNDVSGDEDLIGELYYEAEKIKKSLSSKTEYKFTKKIDKQKYEHIITREIFEKITSIHLDKTKNLLDRCLGIGKEKGVGLENIDKFLLVGGSTRMPQVSNMIKNNYGKEPISQDPDESVAKGAAIYAQNSKQFDDFIEKKAAETGKTVAELKKESLENSNLAHEFAEQSLGAIGQIKISNVLSKTYGMSALKDGVTETIFNILMINDELPATGHETFTTLHDNQNGMRLDFYETMDETKETDIAGKTPVAKSSMTFLKPVPKGTPVDITLILDKDGVIHVKAVERLHGTVLETTIELKNSISEEELEEAKNRIKAVTVE